MRVQDHRMLDDMFDYLEAIRARPVWQPSTRELRDCCRTLVEFLLKHSNVQLELLYVTEDHPCRPARSLPAHDILLVALAESAPNAQLLRQLDGVITHWAVAVVNQPRHIAALSRDQVSRSPSELAGVVMPPTVVAGRGALERLDAGTFHQSELIIRPLGSHARQQLERVADRAALDGYLARVEADQFYQSHFVDYSSAASERLAPKRANTADEQAPVGSPHMEPHEENCSKKMAQIGPKFL